MHKVGKASSSTHAIKSTIITKLLYLVKRVSNDLLIITRLLFLLLLLLLLLFLSLLLLLLLKVFNMKWKKNEATITKATGWCPLLWHFYQEITSDLRVKEIIIIIIMKILLMIIKIILFFLKEHIYLFIHRLKYNIIRESALNKVRPFTATQILPIIVKITCKTLGLNRSIFYYGDSIYNTRYE